MRLGPLGYFSDFIVAGILISYFTAQLAFGTWQIRAEWLASAVLGGAAWTLLEYLIHRWVYHHVPYFQDAHDAHHAEPMAYIGAPPLVGVAIILLVIFVPLAASHMAVAYGGTTGVLIGYCAYMLLHHAAHYWSPAQGSWLYRAKHHHAQHHYLSDHVNFGITTSLWDRVFGTAVRSGRGNTAR
jgi:sterol desaturase/sphingolipid hydroxylase (fatty acid hydroxylase superfamily)